MLFVATGSSRGLDLTRRFGHHIGFVASQLYGKLSVLLIKWRNRWEWHWNPGEVKAYRALWIIDCSGLKRMRLRHLSPFFSFFSLFFFSFGFLWSGVFMWRSWSLVIFWLLDAVKKKSAGGGYNTFELFHFLVLWFETALLVSFSCRRCSCLCSEYTDLTLRSQTLVLFLICYREDCTLTEATSWRFPSSLAPSFHIYAYSPLSTVISLCFCVVNHRVASAI